MAESDSWGSASGPELPFGHKRGWCVLQGGDSVVTAPGHVEGLSCTQDCVSQKGPFVVRPLLTQVEGPEIEGGWVSRLSCPPRGSSRD